MYRTHRHPLRDQANIGHMNDYFPFQVPASPFLPRRICGPAATSGASFNLPHLNDEMANALRRITPGIGHARGAVELDSERRTQTLPVVGPNRWILNRGGVGADRSLRGADRPLRRC